MSKLFIYWVSNEEYQFDIDNTARSYTTSMFTQSWVMSHTHLEVITVTKKTQENKTPRTDLQPTRIKTSPLLCMTEHAQ